MADENDIYSLIDQFDTTSKNRPSKPYTSKIPLQVVGYVLPQHGQPESDQTARIMAKRWDTGESVEVALRSLDYENRPPISRFHHDPSTTSTQTERGGTIIAEGVDEAKDLNPLSGYNVRVLRANWLNRVAQTADEGWGMVAKAQVHEPRLLNPNNPARGYIQSVTILRDDQAQTITSMEQLDRAVLDALDAERRDNDPEDAFKRPGPVGALVRVSSGDKSSIAPLSGGFYQPEGEPYSIPKPRHLVEQDLTDKTYWQERRGMIQQALQSGAATVEVIPTSRPVVGVASMKKSMNGQGVSPVDGKAMDKDGERTPVFSTMVLGIARSPVNGRPQVRIAHPAVRNEIPSRTGIPSPEEKTYFGGETPTQQTTTTPEAPNEPQPAPQAPRPAPEQRKPEPAPQQPQREHHQAPLQVSRMPDSGAVVAKAGNDQQATWLAEVALKNGGTYDPQSASLTMADNQMPKLATEARLNGVRIDVQAEQAAAPAQNNSQPAAAPEPAPQPASEPQQQAPSQPATNAGTEQTDLSELDLSNIDLDSALDQAYQNQSRQFTGPER